MNKFKNSNSMIPLFFTYSIEESHPVIISPLSVLIITSFFLNSLTISLTSVYLSLVVPNSLKKSLISKLNMLKSSFSLSNLLTAYNIIFCSFKDKDMCACSMLDSEQEKDLVDAYDIKEILYRISSYVQAKNLGYNDVLVSYLELKDIEYLISLYDDNNLEDLISKYL